MRRVALSRLERGVGSVERCVRSRILLRASIAVAAAALGLQASFARAQGSGAATIDLTNIGESAVPVGALDVHVELSALGGSGTRYQVLCPDLGPGCGTATPPEPYDTRVAYFASSFPLELGYGLTRAFAIEARVPLHVFIVRPSFSTTRGAPIHEREDIHHHPEKDVGIGDPLLGLKYVIGARHLTSTARVGLSLPFGSTIPNPYVLASEGLWHEHIQFGSGVVSPLLGIGLAYRFRRVTFDARAVMTLSLYDNGWGYRGPSQIFPTVHASMPLFSRAFQPYAAIDLPAASRDHWSVLPPGFLGSAPHATLLAGGGFFWSFRPPIYWDLNFRFRIANVGPGPTYPGTVSLGVGARFDGARQQPPAEPVHQY